MAQRRMTSLEVIDTDAFLDMPQSSQLLYFHLNARADDDGFVSNPKRIMRDVGSQNDDLKVLTAKKFIIPFDDGVCVIKHWRINNFIRKDIYKETKYLNLKQSLLIRGNGAYTLTDDGKAIKVPSGHFKLDFVNEALTKRQLSIGKDRLGKDSIEKDNNIYLQASPARENNQASKIKMKTKVKVKKDGIVVVNPPNEINEIFRLFYESVNPLVPFNNKTQRDAAEELIKKFGFEKVKQMTEYAISIQGKDYTPTITTPLQLKNKFGDLIVYYKRENEKKPLII